MAGDRAARRGDALARARARAAAARVSRVRRRERWLDPAVAAVRAARLRRERARARRRLGAGRARRAAVRRAPRRARRSSSRAPSSERTRSRGCSRRAARRRSASSLRPIGFGERSAATRSPTSSPGTSSTRTSATSAAASARSRRASSRRTCAARRTSSRATRSSGACEEAWERGATEVCLQGGIHPAFTGDYYADVVRAIREAVPSDPRARVLGARGLAGRRDARPLARASTSAHLRDLGLGSLPGTAAEVLDDEVRRVICPDKVTTAQWLAVHDAAHRVGLRSNVTLMFGHADTPRIVGAAPPARARAAAAFGRVHRVRAAPVRADGGADLPPGPSAARPDVPRDAARPRGRAARAPSGDHEHPGLVGEARPRRAPGRRSRPESTTSAGRS